jgi:hypothetical protein
MDLATKKSPWFVNKLLFAFQKIGKNLKLTPGERLCLIALAVYFNEKKGEAWPLHSHLENDTGLSVANINKRLKSLSDKGYISINKRYDKVQKMTRNYYTIHLNVILDAHQNEAGDLKIDEITVDKVVTKQCSNIKQNISSKNCSHIEQEAHGALGSNNEPLVNLTSDRLVNLTSHSPYISLTNNKTTRDTHLKHVQNEVLDDRENHPGGDVIEFGEHYFEEFWATYPRKEAKQKAHRAWMTGQLDRMAAKIIDDVRVRQVKHLPWQEGRKFIPLPASYLNGQRWEDEMITNESESKLRAANGGVNKDIRPGSVADAVIRGRERYERLTRASMETK